MLYRMLGTRQLMVAIDFHIEKKMLWKSLSMAVVYSLVINSYHLLCSAGERYSYRFGTT